MGPNNQHEIKYLTKVENRLPEFYASELLASKGYGVCLYSELEGNQIRLDWFDTKQTTPSPCGREWSFYGLKMSFDISGYHRQGRCRGR